MRVCPPVWGLQFGREMPHPGVAVSLGPGILADTFVWAATERGVLMPDLHGACVSAAGVQRVAKIRGGAGAPAEVVCPLRSQGRLWGLCRAPNPTPAPTCAAAGFGEANTLAAGLRKLAQLCTTGGGGRPFGWEQPAAALESCRMRLPTTLTLMHLLRGLSTRALGVLPAPAAGALGWKACADHTAALCALPQHVRMQWEALWSRCFADAPLLASCKLDSPALASAIAAGRRWIEIAARPSILGFEAGNFSSPGSLQAAHPL